MYDAPIWWLESRLYDGWEWLTGKDRLSLRHGVLTAALVTGTFGYWNHLFWLLVFILFLGMRWFNWPPGRERGYHLTFTRMLTTFAIYLYIGFMFGAFAASMGWLLSFFSDFVLWAHHMNRPRKRRKLLPERIKELLSTLDWVPKPATDNG